MKSVARRFVILSGAGISLREILAESKDPYELHEHFGLSRSQHKIAGVVLMIGVLRLRGMFRERNIPLRSG